MSLYSFTVFIHVTGSIMLGFITGIEWMTVNPAFEISAGVLVISFTGALIPIGRGKRVEVAEPAES